MAEVMAMAEKATTKLFESKTAAITAATAASAEMTDVQTMFLGSISSVPVWTRASE